MAEPPIAERHKHHFHRKSPIKEPVRVATTAPITISTALNNGDSLDGVTLATGDRVLVKDQSSGAENGIYIVGASPARAYDLSTDDPDVMGAIIRVLAGTTNGSTTWVNTNTSTPTIGTTALTFAAGGSGAPTTADYLVGTAQGGLSAEIVVGTTPGGELGGTWASPTVDGTHSGSAHTDFIAKSLLTTQDDIIVRDGTGPARLAKGSDGQVLTVDPTTHHLVWATPSAGSGDVATDTIWDAKGDLAGGTGADTAARLPIGSDGQVLTADSGETTGMKWETPTGGGGGSYSGFALDTIPPSPHASDDEFPGSSLDAKWTDPLTSAAGQTNTIIVANGAMVLEPATAGTSSTGKHVFGIRQNAPAGDFSVFGRLGEKNSTADIRSGIFVAVTGGKAHVCGNFRQDHFIGAIGVSTYSESADWSGFDGFLATNNPNFESWSLPAWVRIRWVSASSTLFFDYSMNGIYYENFSSRTSMTQPNRLGICIYSNSGTIAADAKIAADFFRVTEP